jgi:hypothetical protein
MWVYASVAQRIELPPSKREVVGSNPTGRIFFEAANLRIQSEDQSSTNRNNSRLANHHRWWWLLVLDNNAALRSASSNAGRAKP